MTVFRIEFKQARATSVAEVEPLFNTPPNPTLSEYLDGLTKVGLVGHITPAVECWTFDRKPHLNYARRLGHGSEYFYIEAGTLVEALAMFEKDIAPRHR